MPLPLPEPQRARPKSSREPLTRDDVVIGALAIIDEQGFDSLTMRALATRLQAYPASLYWHAGNRAQLLALVCQRVLTDVELPAAELDWRTWVAEMAREVRRVLAEHPNLAAYLTSQLQVSLVSLEIAEAVLAVLKAAGFRGEQLLMSYNTVMGTVFGWIAAEYAVDPDEGDVEWRKHFEQQLQLADEHQLPTLRAEMSVLSNRAFMLRWSTAKVMPMTGSFDYMVRTLVSGLEAVLAEG